MVPVNQRRNKYGNMPRGALKRALAKPEVFSGKVKGVGGIWQRPKATARGARRGLKLLAAYQSSARYRPRLSFVPRAELKARKEIGPAIARRLAQAVKTAR